MKNAKMKDRNSFIPLVGITVIEQATDCTKIALSVIKDNSYKH